MKTPKMPNNKEFNEVQQLLNQGDQQAAAKRKPEKDLKKGNGEYDLDELACRERSGSVDSKNLLDIFLYLLIRDEVPPGRVESIVTDALKCDEAWFTNGWIAEYAKDIRIRLTEDNRKVTGETK